jgi:uncharacterized protein YcaQ
LDVPAPTLRAAMDTLGFVQVDPLNVCGRMHDLILRHRVAGYREGDLHRFTHAPDRPSFEHHLPDQGILAVFPTEAWPFVKAAMLERRDQLRKGLLRVLTADDPGLARKILREIERRGPLSSDEIEHDGRAITGWGTAGNAVKVMLERLFVHGHVLLCERRGFRRVYDLPERVLPAAVLALKNPGARELARWSALTRLRQRRLVTLSALHRKAIGEEAVEVRVPGCARLYVLRADLPLLAAARTEEPPPPPEPLLLAPLDPLVYDRRVTRELWGLDYTWEAYTPIEKRRRGHYSLPVLSGLELVGTVDPKADRPRGRLRVSGRRIRKGAAIAGGVASLAAFLGLRPPR